MQSLCTLRTPRCRDARNTRYRAARYALPGRDLHPLDRASFAWRTVMMTPTSLTTMNRLAVCIIPLFCAFITLANVRFSRGEPEAEAAVLG